MMPRVRISDVAIWFKHVESPELRRRLLALREEEAIHLETDGVIGRWVRMKTGRDGRLTDAIRPEGGMKDLWASWYKTRRGEEIVLREVLLTDAEFAKPAMQFPEWASQEDEEAFRDL
ncbi:hypothetical protein HNR26_002856 [Rhizobium rosettiformans]|uniref:Uncharacterized protein n=1 Tax=Rhizobium rosettiformans TaxID=1368430 RepID=A0A7W8MD63_9HYPH|nr:hypothetical protein [Rhizobium rosettiformans]MBB5276778.1 hypothetical protein [Rhizobium rosettiformans]